MWDNKYHSNRLITSVMMLESHSSSMTFSVEILTPTRAQLRSEQTKYAIALKITLELLVRFHTSTYVLSTSLILLFMSDVMAQTLTFIGIQSQASTLAIQSAWMNLMKSN